MSIESVFRRFMPARRQITVTRDSVCMADDCNAPNETRLSVTGTERLSDVLLRAAQSLPHTPGAVWAVDSGRYPVGYIILEERRPPQVELCRENGRFLELDIHALHCSYFHAGSFIRREQAGGRSVEEYPACKTLLEKAKRRMQERFREEIQVRGGSLCLWGEWFGRPHDNVHTVESARWSGDTLAIRFRAGESLTVRSPSGMTNETDRLRIRDAAQVVWVWYAYGKARTYGNLYVRQYTKAPDGTLLRAEGKRGDVSAGDGTPFQAGGAYAVSLGQDGG